MPETLTNARIIEFLKQKFKGAGFIDSLKIKYRSLICPFTELIGMVKPGEKAGDVGCGSGQFLLLLTRFSSPSFVYGIEITPRLIENANSLFADQRPGSYEFNTFDGNTFPDKLGEMDIIFLIDVLHHVPPGAQSDFIRNLAAKMKPGARLILKDINASSPLVYANRLHDTIFGGGRGHELKMNDAKKLLESCGLQITSASKRTMYVYPHYTFVAQK